MVNKHSYSIGRTVCQMSPLTGESVPAPPCPVCKSTKTIQTLERFGEVQYFCGDCEHSWTVRTPASSKNPI